MALPFHETNPNAHGGIVDMLRAEIRAASEGSGSVQYLVGKFKSWFEQTPPPGWKVRNGGVLENARQEYPLLWAYLTDPDNAWKLKTAAEWQTMSTATPWNGIGGVPFFVLDDEAETVRLPDTRGMYAEDAGFDGLEVGGVHGDAIRNITGGISLHGWAAAGASGAFNVSSVNSRYTPNTSGATGYGWVSYNAAHVIPTATKNQPRAFGLLPCVYVGE